MADEDVQRSLGAHEARIMRLEGDYRDIRREISDFRLEAKADITGVVTMLTTVRDTVVSGKGGWKAAAWLFGAAALIASLVEGVWHFFIPR